LWKPEQRHPWSTKRYSLASYSGDFNRIARPRLYIGAVLPIPAHYLNTTSGIWRCREYYFAVAAEKNVHRLRRDVFTHNCRFFLSQYFGDSLFLVQKAGKLVITEYYFAHSNIPQLFI